MTREQKLLASLEGSDEEPTIDSLKSIRAFRRRVEKLRDASKKKNVIPKPVPLPTVNDEMYDNFDIYDMEDEDAEYPNKKDKKPRNDYWKDQSSTLIRLYLESFQRNNLPDPCLKSPVQTEKPIDCNCVQRNSSMINVHIVFGM